MPDVLVCMVSGFDRKQFHAEMNRSVVKFFQAML
jgi:hypothetical protein